MISIILIAIFVVSCVQSQCTTDHGTTGVCQELATCDGQYWHGKCGGTATTKCCTHDACFASGVKGDCRTETSCGGMARKVGKPQFCLGDVAGGESLVCCVDQSADVVTDCRAGAPHTGRPVPILGASSYFFWANAVADQNVEYCGPTAAGQTPCSTSIEPYSSAQVRWALPGMSAMVPPGATIFNYKSGLGFQSTLPDVVYVDEDFQMGVFTHYNFVVAGNIPPSADLSLRIDIPGATFAGSNNEFKWTMQIDETDNFGTCAYDSVRPCADKIDFPDSGFDLTGGATLETVDFTLSGSNIKYTMALMGFRREECVGALLDQFVTQETVVNQAVLYARITEGCPVIECAAELIIEQGQCRCTVPFTRAPTPQPTPMPTTPSPTPAPTAMPTPPPTPSPPGCAPWGQYTECSAACGPGKQKRTRTETLATCAVNEEEVDCQLRPCTDSPTPQPTPQPTAAAVIVEADPPFPPAFIGLIATGALLAALAVMAAIFYIMRRSVTPASVRMAQASNNNVVEGNPLYNQQNEEHYNPIHQKPGRS